MPGTSRPPGGGDEVQRMLEYMNNKYSGRGEVPQKPRRNWAPYAVIAGAALLVIGAAISFINRPAPTPPPDSSTEESQTTETEVPRAWTPGSVSTGSSGSGATTSEPPKVGTTTTTTTSTPAPPPPPPRDPLKPRPAFVFGGLAARESLAEATIVMVSPLAGRAERGVYRFNVQDACSLVELPKFAAPGAACPCPVALKARGAGEFVFDVEQAGGAGASKPGLGSCRFVPGPDGVQLVVTASQEAQDDPEVLGAMLAHIPFDAADPYSKTIYRCLIRPRPPEAEVKLGFGGEGETVSGVATDMDCPWPMQVTFVMRSNVEWQPTRSGTRWLWTDPKTKDVVTVDFSVECREGQPGALHIDCPTVQEIHDLAVNSIGQDKALKDVDDKMEGADIRCYDLGNTRNYLSGKLDAMRKELALCSQAGSASMPSPYYNPARAKELAIEIPKTAKEIARLGGEIAKCAAEGKRLRESLGKQGSTSAKALSRARSLMDALRNALMNSRVSLTDPWGIPSNEYRLQVVETSLNRIR